MKNFINSIFEVFRRFRAWLAIDGKGRLRGRVEDPPKCVVELRVRLSLNPSQCMLCENQRPSAGIIYRNDVFTGLLCWPCLKQGEEHFKGVLVAKANKFDWLASRLKALAEGVVWPSEHELKEFNKG